VEGRILECGAGWPKREIVLWSHAITAGRTVSFWHLKEIFLHMAIDIAINTSRDYERIDDERFINSRDPHTIRWAA
jgi:hypothetical protein